MKKTTLTGDDYQTYRAFSGEPDFAPQPLAINHEAALENNLPPESASFPDALLTVIKWTFLYFPGVAAIHFIMMGFALSFFYDGWFIELFLGMLGIFAVAAFMIMFGIGKLWDLKYLKVVLSVFLTSALAGVLYMVLAVLIPGDFFGFFAKITLILPVLVGYFVKGNVDAEAEN
jgi:hypothetical protein